MLLCISHPHILSMVGVSSSPHCVVLDFAPLGNLRLVYDVYRNAGMRMGNFTTRQLAYQVRGEREWCVYRYESSGGFVRDSKNQAVSSCYYL